MMLDIKSEEKQPLIASYKMYFNQGLFLFALQRSPKHQAVKTQHYLIG